MFTAKLKSLIAAPLIRLFDKEAHGLAGKFAGTTGTLRARHDIGRNR